MNTRITEYNEAEDKKHNAITGDTTDACVELDAARAAYLALAQLDPPARSRALGWVERRLEWSSQRPPWRDPQDAEEPPF